MSQPGPRGRFKISVFLSRPKPIMAKQQQFVDRVCDYLDSRGFAPRTLGDTDYDMYAPLTAIRRMLVESNGLISVAFRRTYVQQGEKNYQADIAGIESSPIADQWLTSPWPHIETAMAYQVGLPILILREKGVYEEGLFEKGVVGTYMPVFDVQGSLDQYFASPEWNDLIWKWEYQVRSVVEKKGHPPQLFLPDGPRKGRAVR